MNEQPNNPLHGITLEKLLVRLVDHYGWDELGREIDIRCFNWEPSIKSSLKFLRKNQWARNKVEALYLATDFGQGESPSS
jgi:uncharacterized protein (DUF2132 family)